MVFERCSWMPLCEDPTGWHLVPACEVVWDRAVEQVVGVLAPVAHLLHQVVAVLCAVPGSESARLLAGSKAWLTSALARSPPASPSGSGGEVGLSPTVLNHWLSELRGLQEAGRRAVVDIASPAPRLCEAMWVCPVHTPGVRDRYAREVCV